MRSLVIAAAAAAALASGASASFARADDAPPGAPAAPAAESPQQQYDALKAEFDKARRDFGEELKAAASNEDRQKLIDEKAPNPDDWATRMLAIVAKSPKDPAAWNCLVWIAQNVPNPDVQAKAIDRIMADHLTEPTVAVVCMPLQGSQAPNVEAFLRAVVEKNPDHTAQGTASYALAKLYAYRRDLGKTLAEGDMDLRGKVEKFYGKDATAKLLAADTAALGKKSEEVLDQTAQKYGDVKMGRSTLGEQVANELFEIRNLAIGKVAPEIVGADVDGKPMKLSDFRGKVVALDFFGFW